MNRSCPLLFATALVSIGCPDELCSQASVDWEFTDGAAGFTSETTDVDFDDPWGFDAPEDQDCFSGEACWATNPSGDYGDCRAGRLVSPVVDLSMCAGATASVTLAFRHFFRFEDPSQSRYWDGGLVQIHDGTAWQDTNPSPDYTGDIEGNYSECERAPAMDGEEGWSGRMDDEGWELVRIPVPEALRTAQFRAGWWFTSDRAAGDEGWYIDDVSVFVATDS